MEPNGGGIVILNRMIRQDILKQVIFGQTVEDEGTYCVDKPGRGNFCDMFSEQKWGQWGCSRESQGESGRRWSPRDTEMRMEKA